MEKLSRVDARERIIQFIKIHGPTLPYEISKQIGGDTFLSSAYLSELKEAGKLKISNIKIGGGSPLYFLPGQEGMLEKFSDNLGEKERQIFEILKEKRVVREINLVPVHRAAIKSIKDFAMPLSVTINGQTEIFWKWYLLSNQDAETCIKDMLNIKQETKPETEIIGKKIPEPVEQSEKEIQKAEPASTSQEKKQATKQEETKKEGSESPAIETGAETKKTEEKKDSPRKKTEQATLREQKKEDEKSKGDFYDDVLSFFKEKEIKIIEETIIRRASENDFIVEIPSAVGQLRYYVKSKSKKKINEGDLSSVFFQAQSKRMPVLFLSKGDLTAKAKEMLDNEFKGMKFNQI